MAMRDLIQTAVELGMDRHSVLFGKPTAKTRRRERELLERITADRRLIGSLTAPVVRQEHPPAGPARAADRSEERRGGHERRTRASPSRRHRKTGRSRM